MACVLNTLYKEQSVQVHGAWFTFKPKQVKVMDENKVSFLSSNLAYLGFVSLPNEFEDPDHRTTKEGKEEFAKAEETGIKNRVTFLESLARNQFSSLAADYQRKNDKSDPRLEWSPKMVEQMKELGEYKKELHKKQAEQVAQINEIEKMLQS